MNDAIEKEVRLEDEDEAMNDVFEDGVITEYYMPTTSKEDLDKDIKNGISSKGMLSKHYKKIILDHPMKYRVLKEFRNE